MDYIDKVIEWSNSEGDLKEWRHHLSYYLKQWGWNKKAINHFYAWGENGFNNKLLHIETDLDKFYREVHYCSDRMSLDRLFRCHVMFRTLTIQAAKEWE